MRHHSAGNPVENTIVEGFLNHLMQAFAGDALGRFLLASEIERQPHDVRSPVDPDLASAAIRLERFSLHQFGNVSRFQDQNQVAFVVG